MRWVYRRFKSQNVLRLFDSNLRPIPMSIFCTLEKCDNNLDYMFPPWRRLKTRHDSNISIPSVAPGLHQNLQAVFPSWRSFKICPTRVSRLRWKQGKLHLFSIFISVCKFHPDSLFTQKIFISQGNEERWNEMQQRGAEWHENDDGSFRLRLNFLYNFLVHSFSFFVADLQEEYNPKNIFVTTLEWGCIVLLLLKATWIISVVPPSPWSESCERSRGRYSIHSTVIMIMDMITIMVLRTIIQREWLFKILTAIV